MRRRTVSLTDKVVDMVDRLARRNVAGDPSTSRIVNGAARDGGVAARVLSDPLHPTEGTDDSHCFSKNLTTEVPSRDSDR